jgi:protein gp37
MADHSGIEWTEATWNVVTGCTRVSDGCDHCYIERTPPFRIAGRRFDHPGVGGTTGVVLHPDRLGLPLRWRRPRRVFVNSMSDLFHDAVPDGFIAQVWNVMAHCPQHVFQILTKRHARMRSWVTRWADHDDGPIGDGLPPLPRGPKAVRSVYTSGRAQLFADMLDSMGDPPPGCAYPLYDWAEGQRWWPSVLPNVWLGVSVENQQWADTRIPALLDTPAAVRWLSCEPLLGPVDLSRYLWLTSGSTAGPFRDHAGRRRFGGGVGGQAFTSIPAGGLHWIVVGGESGPGARPMHPRWAEALLDQCHDAGVPYFFKQSGEFTPYVPSVPDPTRPDGYAPDWDRPPTAWVNVDDGRTVATEAEASNGGDWSAVWRVGKKAAGRRLAGRTWDEYPRYRGGDF